MILLHQHFLPSSCHKKPADVVGIRFSKGSSSNKLANLKQFTRSWHAFYRGRRKSRRERGASLSLPEACNNVRGEEGV